MISDREAIYSALASLVFSISDWKTKGRKLIHWNDVQPPDQPACFVVDGNEQIEHVAGTSGLPNKYVLSPHIWIYSYADGDPTVFPRTQLNALLDKVDRLFKPDGSRDAITLNKLVTRVRINGTIDTDNGLLGPQAFAIIPLEIIAT